MHKFIHLVKYLLNSNFVSYDVSIIIIKIYHKFRVNIINELDSI
jgi:hypothetical protein